MIKEEKEIYRLKKEIEKFKEILSSITNTSIYRGELLLKIVKELKVGYPKAGFYKNEIIDKIKDLKYGNNKTKRSI